MYYSVNIWLTLRASKYMHLLTHDQNWYVHRVQNLLKTCLQKPLAFYNVLKNCTSLWMILPCCIFKTLKFQSELPFQTERFLDYGPISDINRLLDDYC